MLQHGVFFNALVNKSCIVLLVTKSRGVHSLSYMARIGNFGTPALLKLQFTWTSLWNPKRVLLQTWTYSHHVLRPVVCMSGEDPASPPLANCNSKSPRETHTDAKCAEEFIEWSKFQLRQTTSHERTFKPIVAKYICWGETWRQESVSIMWDCLSLLELWSLNKLFSTFGIGVRLSDLHLRFTWSIRGLWKPQA